jgi:hypothetical protein
MDNRKQFDVLVEKKVGRDIWKLGYTIVMNDNKVIRIFNNTKSWKGVPLFHTIEPTSEMFLYLKKKYEISVATALEMTNLEFETLLLTTNLNLN